MPRQPDTTIYDVNVGDSPYLGPKDAAVTIVEFSDFQCPFCIREVPTLKKLLEDYPDDPRGHSCLVLGYTEHGPVHVVCGLSRQGRLYIITVYVPSLPKWVDERRRARDAEG